MSYIINTPYKNIMINLGFHATINDIHFLSNSEGIVPEKKKLRENCSLWTPFVLTEENIDEFDDLVSRLGFKNEEVFINSNKNLIIQETPEKGNEVAIYAYNIFKDNKDNRFIIYSIPNLVFCVDSKNQKLLKKIDTLLYYFEGGRDVFREIVKEEVPTHGIIAALGEDLEDACKRGGIDIKEVMSGTVPTPFKLSALLDDYTEMKYSTFFPLRSSNLPTARR